MGVEMKIAYRRADGMISTAYVDERATTAGTHVGEDKYTEERVVVQWSDAWSEWQEVQA